MISFHFHDERLRVLHQHDLPHEEVAESDDLIDVGIGILLVGENDVAADAAAAGFLCAAVGGFHDAGPAAGQHRKPRVGQPRADLAGHAAMPGLTARSGW